MYFSILGAAITIVVNLLLIPIIGFVASAWATLLAYGSMMLISYFVGKKHYPVPYNLKKSGSYLLAAITISYISFTYFRENYFISIGLLILFGLMTFWNERNDLKNLLKK